MQPAASPPDPNRWKGLAICLVGGFMVLLDVSIVNVALPSIRTGLHATESDLQWIISGYALTFGLILVPAGRIGDTRGRRTLFMVAMALFTLTSALCGAAQGALWLVIARLLQGFAGGMLTPQISGLIQQMFSGRERGTAFGLFGTMVGISTAIGPLLGGLLIQAAGVEEGWRWVFYVNLPIGLVAIPLARRLLPAPDPSLRTRRHNLDPVGVLLLGAGVVTLLLPFVEQQQWHGDGKWVLVPLAIALLVAFISWESQYCRHGCEPLVDLALFRRTSYSFGISMITLYFAGFTSIFFIYTLFLQEGLSYSALAAGLAITPFALGSAVSAAVGGRIVYRYGRMLIAVGLAMVVIGLAGTILAARAVPSHGTGWATLVPLLFAGLGSGLVIAPNQTITLSEVPVEQGGTAGGLLQTGQRIGAAVGIAAVGSVFFARLSATHGRGWASAFEHGLMVSVAFVLAALIVAVVDVVTGLRVRKPQPAAPTVSERSA